MVYELNETGSWLLEHCDGTRTLEQLTVGLAAHFEVSQDELSADVAAYLDQLYRAGLVV